MAKIKFIDIPNDEKEAIFNQISTKTGLPPFAVEKDWWVVQALAVIFEMEVGKHLVFKGGTSLSKAWKLIDRFSEDVDLSIDRAFFCFEGELTKKQQTALRKAAGAFISGIFLAELQAKFTSNGFEGVRFHLVDAKDTDQDPRIIEVYYPNVIPATNYLEPKVQIEVGCRSLKEPFTVRTITSLVDEEYAGNDFAQTPIHIPTVNPERTFLEKLFLLHEEFQRPHTKMRVDRLSRHLYDIVKLSKTVFASKALSDKQLYQTLVEHRHTFARLGGVNYNLHQPQTINCLPPPQFIDAWRADYNKMIEQMIYEENPPSFNEIIAELTLLNNTLHELTWKMEKQFPIPNSY